MNEKAVDQERITFLKQKLEESYLDLLFQLSQIEFGEASLTCIVKENEIAFAGVSRTKNIMFDKQKKH